MNANKNKNNQPNKVKIDLALDRCKDSIQGLLNQYQTSVEAYLSKIVTLKRERRISEVDRYKQKLKLVLARQAKMQDLMDQVEQFSFMIDEAFAKNDVYASIGTVLDETNKISISPEIKKILKQVSDFDDIFSKGIKKMDGIFGRVSKKISDIDNATSSVNDKEIEDIVSSRLEQYDEITSQEAEADEDLFNLKK